MKTLMTRLKNVAQALNASICLATIVAKVNQSLLDIETLSISIKHIDEILMKVCPFQVKDHAETLSTATDLKVGLSMAPVYGTNHSWRSFQMNAKEYPKIMESSIGWME